MNDWSLKEVKSVWLVDLTLGHVTFYINHVSVFQPDRTKTGSVFDSE